MTHWKEINHIDASEEGTNYKHSLKNKLVTRQTCQKFEKVFIVWNGWFIYE